MAPNDFPQESPRHSEVRSAQSKQEVSKFLDEWIKPSPTDKSGGKVATTFSLGQIQEMQPPAGWQEGKPVKPTAGSSLYQEFHPADQPDVRLCFYYRGRRVSESAGEAFHDILQKPAHTLSAAELTSIKEVLRDKANPNAFGTLAARTEDMNGKRVLVIEGHYKGIQHDTHAIFIDSDGTGSAVQEVYYQAHKDKYERYHQAALGSLKSIGWK